jgi:N-glycosidase YbiA
MARKMEERKYKRGEVITFNKTKEEFGGLSNMASGYPIFINGIKILSSEALYQACRYPLNEKAQFEIISQKSPMTAKMKSKKYLKETRNDWDDVRMQIMRWVLRVKLFQNWEKFYVLLSSTGFLPIVEESKRDDFWGAKASDKQLLIGVNALGRLLMELRDEMYCFSDNEYIVKVPNIDNFKLMGKGITSQKFYVNTPEYKVIPNDKENQIKLF